MVPGEVLSEAVQAEARWVWLHARDVAVRTAKSLLAKGVHKQWANRLVEPFTWIYAVITATDWGNFYALRLADDVQAETRSLAEAMRDAMAASGPVLRRPGDWHLPYVTDPERSIHDINTCLSLSVARCARVSYRPFDGEADLARETDRADSLLRDGHMSPFEHQAEPAYSPLWVSGNFVGWKQHRKTIPGERRKFKPANGG
jgi:thymidylate synthase ThyX